MPPLPVLMARTSTTVLDNRPDDPAQLKEWCTSKKSALEATSLVQTTV
jgi:hypothetical protein